MKTLIDEAIPVINELRKRATYHEQQSLKMREMAKRLEHNTNAAVEHVNGVLDEIHQFAEFVSGARNG